MNANFTLTMKVLIKISNLSYLKEHEKGGKPWHEVSFNLSFSHVYLLESFLDDFFKLL